MNRLLFIIVALVCNSSILIGQTSNIFHDSLKTTNGQSVCFSYTQDSLKTDLRLIKKVLEIKYKLGSANLYLIQRDEISFDLLGDTQLFYTKAWLDSNASADQYQQLLTGLVNIFLQSGESIIILSSENSVNELSKKLQTVRKTKELIKFYKPE